MNASGGREARRGQGGASSASAELPPGLLARALTELERQAGGRAADLVERVEVRPDGALELALSTRPERRWMRYAEGQLLERRPTDDQELPAARALAPGGELAGSSVLAWRPGRRILLDPGQPAGLLMKAYRPQRFADAERRTRVCRQACLAAGLATANVLETRRDLAALALQRLDGAPLSLAGADAERFFQLGAALRSFQVPGDELAAHDAAAELGVLDTWAARARAVGLAEPERWSALRAELGRRASELPPAEALLCHRDLHEGQCLLLEDGLALLDFDLACRADPCLDPANLLAHLALRGLQRLQGATAYAARACGEALLDGLDRAGEPGYWERLRYYQAASFLRLALVYGLRPRWSHLSGELVRLGGRCLDERRA